MTFISGRSLGVALVALSVISHQLIVSGAPHVSPLSAFPDPRTYHDLDDVLTMSPSTRTALNVAVRPRAESGFLRAVTSLMQESASTYRGSLKPPAGLHRLYVYGGTLYDMTLRRWRKADAADELESDFQVRNRTTGTTTQFQISYATSGSDPGVARRIVYRPRWWLELELLRKGMAFARAQFEGHALMSGEPALAHALGTAGVLLELRMDAATLVAGLLAPAAGAPERARQVRERRADVVSIFVLPPSVEELVARLGGRGTDRPADLVARLRRAVDELAEAHHYDYLVVNDDRTQAVAEVAAIIDAEGRRTRRQQASLDRVTELRRGLSQLMEGMPRPAPIKGPIKGKD